MIIRKTPLPEWLVVVIVAVATLAFITVIVTRKTISVPAEYCKKVLTGRTQVHAETTYNCFSYDSKTGMCALQIPSTYYYTDKEVRVSCDYLEWQ